ncbi:leucine-rich repeat neuronal protein 2 [Daphnia magna]|uniref:leucine-rich repeat neuronal protein 2 n=1 Tax=Daphnia magna TaxID=35525 RepID=UPI001E1BBF08|nr:leucine-rich repeat neuronal protein 2 [Daphnia magna]
MSVLHRQGRQSMMAFAISLVCCGLLLSSQLMVAEAFCPSQCQCNDHALEADCAGSRLDVVPILLNPALRSLRLAHNRIATIRQSLDFYADLELLDVSHNALTGLGQRQLGSQKVLRALNFSHNAIAHLDSHAFQGLGQLQVLDLRHNELTAIDDGSLSELVNLVQLDLSDNRIERLSDQCFASLVRLRSLNLRANRLQQLAPSPSWTPLAASLLSLDLSHNLLAQLDGGDGGLSALIELRQLNLSNNTLHHIHYAAFEGLARLSELDLSANRLEYVPSDALSPLGASLRLLDLSANYMSQVGAGAFAPLAQLETLRMSDVLTLQSIHADAMAFLNATLQTLVLSNNRQWKALHPQMLSQLKRLRYVDLSGSGLQTMRQIDDWPPHLEHFDLSGNPLQCNCSMHWLWQHQNQLEHKSNGSEATFSAPMKDIVCQGPESLVGRHFFQLEESHLLCWTLAQIIAIALVSALAVIVVTAVALLCCWRRRRLHQKHAPSSSSSTSSSGSSTATSHHHHHLPATAVLHPHHVKNLTNNMLHQPHLHHHHHHHHVGHANHLDHLEQHQHLHHHNLYQTPDSPPLKSKTLSFPKTVDYFLNDDDYVYHPGGHIKPIPVTAV